MCDFDDTPKSRDFLFWTPCIHATFDIFNLQLLAYVLYSHPVIQLLNYFTSRLTRTARKFIALDLD